MTEPFEEGGAGTATAHEEYSSSYGGGGAVESKGYDDDSPAKSRKNAKKQGNSAADSHQVIDSTVVSDGQPMQAQSHTDSVAQPDPTPSVVDISLYRSDEQERKRVEKELRKAAKEQRAEIERERLAQLTEHEQKIIEQALDIIIETKSRWLVMAFKRIASVQSRDLFTKLGETERFFEPVNGGDYWREAWRDPVLNKRLDEHASRKKLGVFITKLLRLYGV